MITILKLAGVSAFLSAGVVTALDPAPVQVPGSGKAHRDRLAAAPAERIRLADASAGVKSLVAEASVRDCRSQAWPYVAQDCIAGGEGAGRRVVRTITIERRDAPATSTLVRIPVQGTPLD